MDEKFSKEIKIVGKKQKKLEIKSSINQIKNTVGSIMSRQDQGEEIISGIKDMIEKKYCTQITTKKKYEP
jgi:hypothetical protein